MPSLHLEGQEFPRPYTRVHTIPRPNPLVDRWGIPPLVQPGAGTLVMAHNLDGPKRSCRYADCLCPFHLTRSGKFLGLPITGSFHGVRLFPPLARPEWPHIVEAGRHIAPLDSPFHLAAEGDPTNLTLCQRGEWNDRLLGETVRAMLTLVSHGKKAMQ